MHSSNLALRFYIREGWTKELLETFVTKGKVAHCSGFETEREDMKYYLPGAYTTMDVDRLMEHVGEVKRRFDDFPEETDREFIKRMLW